MLKYCNVFSLIDCCPAFIKLGLAILRFLSLVVFRYKDNIIMDKKLFNFLNFTVVYVNSAKINTPLLLEI